MPEYGHLIPSARMMAETGLLISSFCLVCFRPMTIQRVGASATDSMITVECPEGHGTFEVRWKRDG